MLRHIEGYSNTFKDILAYSGILMHIQPHSQGATRGRMEASPVLVENWKMCLVFRKKYSDYVHLCVKSDLKLNLREKNSKKFLCETSFSCIFDEMFIDVS